MILTKDEVDRLKAVYLSPSTLRWTTLDQDMHSLVGTIEAAWQEIEVKDKEIIEIRDEQRSLKYGLEKAKKDLEEVVGEYDLKCARFNILKDESRQEIARLNAGWEAANATLLERDFKIIGLVDELARCAAELDALKESLEWAKSYDPFSSRACPLCTYEQGTLLKMCSLHTQIDELEADATAHSLLLIRIRQLAIFVTERLKRL